MSSAAVSGTCRRISSASTTSRPESTRAVIEGGEVVAANVVGLRERVPDHLTRRLLEREQVEPREVVRRGRQPPDRHQQPAVGDVVPLGEDGQHDPRDPDVVAGGEGDERLGRQLEAAHLRDRAREGAVALERPPAVDPLVVEALCHAGGGGAQDLARRVVEVASARDRDVARGGTRRPATALPPPPARPRATDGPARSEPAEHDDRPEDVADARYQRCQSRAPAYGVPLTWASRG